MLCRLTNAPPTFQAYINHFLRPYMDHFAVCYLVDILIRLTNEEENEQQEWNVLERLWEFGLWGKPTSAIVHSQRSGFSGWLSALIRVPLTSMAYQALWTSQPWSPFGICRCFLVQYTFTSGSSGNVHRVQCQYQTDYRMQRVPGCLNRSTGNGLGMPNSHSGP